MTLKRTCTLSLILTKKWIKPIKPNGQTIVYMLGYGGRIWHSRRQLNALRNDGYQVFVMDFKDVLRRHRPDDLVDLMDEVAKVLVQEQLIREDVLIVGISMGGLIGINMLKRFAVMHRLLVITGGDMTRIPLAMSLRFQWRMSRKILSRYWQSVNIYTPVGELKAKHIIMVLPQRDKVIDAHEVKDEITRHSHLNTIKIISVPGGHFRTIINQTVIKPRASFQYMKALLDEPVTPT